MTAERPEPSDDVYVREVLWDLLPDARPVITSMEEEEREFADSVGEGADEPTVGMYSLASEVLVGSALREVFRDESPDEESARRCSEVIERLLGSSRPQVCEMVSIRVTDHLLGYPDNWLRFKGYAGPLLRAEVRSRSRYYTGPF